MKNDRELPVGIYCEPGRGFVVDVRVRPYPKRRKRFHRDTPIETMLAWREAQRTDLHAWRDAERAALQVQRTAGLKALPPPHGFKGLGLRIMYALERIAIAIEQEQEAR